MNDLLQKGFPLEKPDFILEWNKPLDELAKQSEAIWTGEEYVWENVTYQFYY